MRIMQGDQQSGHLHARDDAAHRLRGLGHLWSALRRRDGDDLCLSDQLYLVRQRGELHQQHGDHSGPLQR